MSVNRFIKLGFICFLFCSLFLIFPPMISSVAAAPIDGIDAILVIDTSGSMRSADPERITLEAASLFMDMMETRNSRIAVIQFSGGLHTVMPLTPINEISTRANVRQTVSGFVYQGWTDIGLAMRAAAQMLLDDPVETNSPMILLFTDGRIDLPAGWAGGRTIEASYADAWWALEAVEDFAAIYTIGLNHDGSLNEEFLREMATRSGAQSFIADDAAYLPQIFNEIFASHIRSSITEVAMIIADGETYEDVHIPIPSAFVSEANIIMLSTRPIPSVRLFDPSGREIEFDNETYTLTYANRYSMIKILEPMVGEWLLSVRGVAEDRITVNLIYNYNVTVSLSVTQPDAEEPGMFFNPELPVMVQAGFISALPSSQIQTLFNESVATMFIFDEDLNLAESVEMVSTGSAFALEFMLDPPRNVYISVGVTHEGFDQTTVGSAVLFAPEVIAEAQAREQEQAGQTNDDEQNDPPDVTPAPTPDADPDDIPYEIPPREIQTPSFLIFVLIGVALMLVLAALILRAVSIRRTKNRLYTGHLEIRALLADGNYSALEAPDLSTFAGQMSLMEFLTNSLGGAKADKFSLSGIPVWDIHLTPGMVGNRPVIYVNKKAECHVTDGDGNAIFKKKIMWDDNQQLIFSLPGETPRIEITYRVGEDG
ncbi:MAG: VWA domain-containing protein [Defluviitaleaceae bacterium]|nr:VWA domain-containing protein [Defluviitaleaceae bacterium]